MTNTYHRNLAIFLLIAGTVLSVCAERTLGGGQQGRHGSAAKMAGQDYTLLFEGTTNLSAELRQQIAEDIALNLSHLKHVKFRTVPQGRKEPSQKYRRTITHWIDEGKEKRLFPEAMEKYFGGTIRSNDTFCLVVHEKLVEQYVKALKFKDAHPEMFKKLDDFLSFINDPRKLDAVAGDTDAAKGMFFFSGNPPQGYKYERELLGLKQMRVRRPSVLDFQSMTHDGKQIIYFSTITRSREGSDQDFIMKGFPLFAYVNDKWVIYVPRMP